MRADFLNQPRRLLVAVAVLCFAAVGTAVVSQYRFNMQPCPWCTLQRLIFLVTGSLALLGAMLPEVLWRRALSALLSLAALSGVGAALWQHFVAAASASCKLTLADKILQNLGLMDLAPDLFVPTASCADAAVSLLGVPYAIWSMSLFALCLFAGARVAFSTR